MHIQKSFDISPIGYVHSTLKQHSGAPRQGWEGAPNATLEIYPAFVQGLDGIKPGQDIWIFTWLLNPIMGVFATLLRTGPNPIGLHRAKVLSIDGDRWLQVQGLEAIDGTPTISSRFSNAAAILEDPLLAAMKPQAAGD